MVIYTPLHSFIHTFTDICNVKNWLEFFILMFYFLILNYESVLERFFCMHLHWYLYCKTLIRFFYFLMFCFHFLSFQNVWLKRSHWLTFLYATSIVFGLFAFLHKTLLDYLINGKHLWDFVFLKKFFSDYFMIKNALHFFTFM